MKEETKAVVLPKELNEAVSKSNITDLTKAEKLASNYAPLMNEVTEQMEKLKTLEKGKQEHVEIAKRIRLDCGKIAARTSEQKKEDKALVLLEGRFIDSLHNTVEGAARLTQVEAKEIETHFEKIEQERIDKIENERIVELSEYMPEETMPPNLGNMSDDIYTNYLNGVKLAKQAEIEAEKKEKEEILLNARLDIVEKERKEKAIEYKQFWTGDYAFRAMSDSDFETVMVTLKLAKEDFDKEQERVRAENERLHKEAKEKAKREKKEKERLERKIIKEKEDRRLSAIDFLLQEGFVNTHGGMQAKGYAHFIGANHYSDIDTDKELEAFKSSVTTTKEQEELKAKLKAKEKAEREEKQRLLDEELKRQKAEKDALLAPDKDKLLVFAETLKNLNYPELKSTEAQNVIQRTMTLINKTIEDLTEQANKL